MNRIKRPRRDLLIMVGFLCIGVFLWMGNKTVYRSSDESIHSIGGSLSATSQRILRRMNQDIVNAQYLISAESDHITFLCDDKGTREYSFAYQTIWRNEFPLMGSVKSFHFEYRDSRGNLISRPTENLESVDVVSYTLCLVHGEKDVFVNYRLNIPCVGMPPSYDRTGIEVAHFDRHNDDGKGTP